MCACAGSHVECVRLMLWSPHTNFSLVNQVAQVICYIVSPLLSYYLKRYVTFCYVLPYTSIS